MKKHIVLSVNWNPDYLYYAPLVCWAWENFGWEPIVFINGLDDQPPLFDLVSRHCNKTLQNWRKVFKIDGYRSDTITQVSRLYGACIAPADSYLMTGDIDMIPLSDYWQPKENEITVYGHDLTGLGNYPICYIGMPTHGWKEVMNLDSTDFNALIKRDLSEIPKASSEKWEDYWETDQDLITARLKPYRINTKLRGQYPNGYAYGRVDRGDWHLNHQEFIDAHLLRDIYKVPENLAKTLLLLYKIWPQEDFTWFTDYTVEFGKIAKQIYG